MDHLKKHLRDRLQQKKIYMQSAGAFILYHTKKYLSYPENIHGKLEGQVFVLHCDSREDKTALLLQRMSIVEEINTALEKA